MFLKEMILLKKILVLLMAMVMLLSATTLASGEISVLLSGEKLSFEVAPLIIKDRTMVPFRAIGEALSSTVAWDDASKTVTLTRVNNNLTTVVTLVIDNPVSTVELFAPNEKGETVSVQKFTINMDVAATIVSGRTLVPLRFVSEALTCTVSWDSVDKTVYIDPMSGNEFELFKMRADGTGLHRVNPLIIDGARKAVINQNLFFIGLDGNLYNNKLALTEVTVKTFAIRGTYAYYITNTDALFRVPVTGGESVKLADKVLDLKDYDQLSCVVPDKVRGQNFAFINEDGTLNYMELESSMVPVFAKDNYVYFRRLALTPDGISISLIRQHANDKKNQEVAIISGQAEIISNGWIYYVNKNQTFRVKEDLSQREKIADIALTPVGGETLILNGEQGVYAMVNGACVLVSPKDSAIDTFDLLGVAYFVGNSSISKLVGDKAEKVVDVKNPTVIGAIDGNIYFEAAN